MRVYAVLSDSLEEAIELYVDRREAERVLENWNQDEPSVLASFTSRRSSSRRP